MHKQWRLIRLSSTGTLAVGVLLGTLGCCPGAHQTAQAPPPPKPCPASPAPTPPPPPPPKCETLDEQCTATAETRLAIGDNTAAFQPPAGWLYAKEQQSVTRSPDGKAWLAFTNTSSDDSQDLLPSIESLVLRLQVEGVNPKFLKDRLKKPQHEVEADGITTKLWEVDKKSQAGAEPMLRGSEPGTLLVAVVPLTDDNLVVGTAFVTTAMGDSYAPIVMKSVQSLRPLAPSVAAASNESPNSGQTEQ